MLYGIKSDTFALSREVNEWDVQAFSYLYPLANQNLMRRIERPELPPAALDALSVALKNRRVIDKVAFVNLGRVERDDLIPQMADFSLVVRRHRMGFRQRRIRFQLHHFRAQCRICARGRASPQRSFRRHRLGRAATRRWRKRSFPLRQFRQMGYRSAQHPANEEGSADCSCSLRCTVLR